MMVRVKIDKTLHEVSGEYENDHERSSLYRI
jgi:hypothetical protein